MKRILFVNERLGGGGAERVMALLANKLSLLGYDVAIALFCESDTPNYQLEKNIKIYYLKNTKRLDRYFTNNRLENIRLKLQKKSGLFNEIYTLFSLDEGKTKPLKKFLSNHKFDVLISFLVEPNIAAIRAARNMKGVKVIVSERNVPVSYRVSPMIVKIRDKLYKYCDVCVFQTTEIMNWFSDDVKKKGVIILNPIKEDLPEPFSGERRQKVVTNFCGFKEQKNLPLLITAFAKFRKSHTDYELHIYGDGDRGVLDALIDELNIKDSVKIYPFSYDIHENILDYRMFVSSSDFEGISNSMLEAMAIGLPTICTDCDGGGARETIVDHVNGLLVPKKDSEALAKAMCEVADQNELVERLSNNSIKIRKQLKPEIIIQKWISLFDEAEEKDA